MAFDPSQFGATPAAQPAAAKFDPTQFGATPATPAATPPAFKYPVVQSAADKSNQLAASKTDTAQAVKDSQRANSFTGILGNTVAGVGSTLASSEVGLGQSIGKIFGEHPDNISQAITLKEGIATHLIKQIATEKAAGKDTTKLEQTYNDLRDSLSKDRDTLKAQTDLPSTGKVLGQIGGTALDLATAGTYGPEAEAMKTGELAAKPAAEALPSVVKGARATSGLLTKEGVTKVAEGAGLGYGFDVTQNLQNDKTGAEAFKPGLGTLTGALIPGALEGEKTITSGQATEAANKLKQSAVDSLEQKYEEIASGTTAGKRKVDAVTQKTEAMNRAGTEGRTPQRVLAESGIIPERQGTKLDTFDQAAQFRKTVEPLQTANRAALKEVGLSTAPIKLDDLESRALSNARTPENINSGRYATMEKQIQSRFDTLRTHYPSGEIPLQVVDDIKSAHWDNVFKNKSIVEADRLAKDADYAIAKSMQKTIEETADKAGATQVAQLNREIGDRLGAAKFLEDLNGKTIKGGRLLKYTTSLIGASAGKTLPGKVIGAIGGNFIGDLIISNNVAGPIKRILLNNLEAKDPVAFTKTIEWLKQQNLDAETKKLLPVVIPDSPVSRPPVYVTPGGKASAIKSEAADVAAVEQGKAKQPQMNGPFSRRPTVAAGLGEQYTKPEDMPVIDFGKTKNTTSSLPTVKGAPNVYTGENTIVGKLIDKYNSIPNKEGGFIKIPSNIHPDDLHTLRDFSDYVNKAYTPGQQAAIDLEIAARRIVEKYGITAPDVSNRRLSTQIGTLLDAKLNLNGKTTTLRDELGRFTSNDGTFSRRNNSTKTR